MALVKITHRRFGATIFAQSSLAPLKQKASQVHKKWTAFKWDKFHDITYKSERCNVSLDEYSFELVHIMEPAKLRMLDSLFSMLRQTVRSIVQYNQEELQSIITTLCTEQKWF